jgi:hypothetical protein
VDQQAPPLRARLRNQTRPPRSHGPPRHDHDQATRPNLTVFKHPLTQPTGSAANPRKPTWTAYDPNEVDEPKPRSPKALLAWMRRRHHLPSPEETSLLDTVAADSDDDQPDDRSQP